MSFRSRNLNDGIDLPGHKGAVGVIGAGAMGRGIALVASAAGHPVLLFDADSGVAHAAMERSREDLRKLVERGKLEQGEADRRIAGIRIVETTAELGDVALVIEAIVEDLAVKRNVFLELESIVAADTILATNTSSLSVTEIGASLTKPGRFAGMHFFNPATVMPLVEVIHGVATEPQVIQKLVDTAKSWGKVPVVCGSSPGFIVNRLARPFYGEAMRLLSERAATPASIDALMKESGGFRMGPLELTDFIGQDVNFAVNCSVFEGFFQDPRYQPSSVQRDLVAAGCLGRKSGQGFFDYAADAVRPEPEAAAAGTKPEKVQICGDLGPANQLAELCEDAMIDVVRSDGPGHIQLGDLCLQLTDGRLAAEHMASRGPVALFDLALDYRQASRIGIAFPDELAHQHAQAAVGFFQALGKIVSVIDDAAGMVVMRTVAMLINEAVDALHQSLASADDIETAMIKGVNYPIGLLAWGQRLGADRVLSVMENLARIYPTGRYRPSPLLRRMKQSQTIQGKRGES